MFDVFINGNWSFWICTAGSESDSAGDHWCPKNVGHASWWLAFPEGEYNPSHVRGASDSSSVGQFSDFPISPPNFDLYLGTYIFPPLKPAQNVEWMIFGGSHGVSSITPGGYRNRQGWTLTGDRFAHEASPREAFGQSLGCNPPVQWPVRFGWRFSVPQMVTWEPHFWMPETVQSGFESYLEPIIFA